MNSESLTKFINEIPDLEISDANVKNISKKIFDTIFENNDELSDKLVDSVEKFYKVLDINNDGKVDLIKTNVNEEKLDIKNVEIELGSDLKDLDGVKNLILSDNPNATDILTTSLSLIELYFTDEHYSETLDEIEDFVNSINEIIDMVDFNKKLNDKLKDKDELIKLICMVFVLILPIQKLLKENKKVNSENLNEYVLKVYGNKFRVDLMMRLLSKVVKIISSKMIDVVAKCICC